LGDDQLRQRVERVELFENIPISDRVAIFASVIADGKFRLRSSNVDLALD
jgi:hypothetical protein